MDVVKVRGHAVAVRAGMPPSGENCGTRVGLVLDPIGIRTPLVRQLMTLIRRKAPIEILDVRLLSLAATSRAR
jgi:hypothetical protein